MGRIVTKRFLDDIQVCDFLNDANDRGWALNNFFIKITQTRSDMFVVFFDEDILDEPKRKRPFYIP